MNNKPIIMITSWPPRKCGIATFTTDLCESIASEIDHSHEVFAIAITNTPERYAYPSRVKFEIRQSYLQDYSHAAEFLNFSQVNILSLQYEYGIFTEITSEKEEKSISKNKGND